MKKVKMLLALIFTWNTTLAQVTHTGSVLINGANDNDGKADLAVSVGNGGSATIALSGDQFRVGSTDVNWSMWVGATGQIQTYNQDLTLYASGGSSASHAIRFFTRNNGIARERLTLAPNGFLGIGTVTPNSDLEIVGTSGTANSGNFKVTYAYGGGLTGTELSGLVHEPSLVGGNGWTALLARKGSAFRAAVFDGHTDILNGHLTIDSGSHPVIYTSSSSDETNRYLQILNSSNYQSASGLRVGGVLISDTYSYANPTKNDLVVKGSVSIGTPNIDPNSVINANGTIRSKKVKVEANGWPDYVFEPDFHLRPLSVLESYIRINNHLPEVPSAKEIEKDGLDLGQMDATLLKKIEELTLYTIQQEKKIESQKTENDLLEELVKDLIKRIEKLEKK
jgi:hypothetical protein